MPIDFNSNITSLSKKTFGNTFLSGLLGNTISISFVISLIIVLIIMIMYPAKAGTKFTIFAKMMIYIYFSVLLVLFLHDSIIKYRVKEDLEKNIEEDGMIRMTADDDVIYNTKRINPLPTNEKKSEDDKNTRTTDKEPEEREERDDTIKVGGDAGSLPVIKGGGGSVNIFAL